MAPKRKRAAKKKTDAAEYLLHVVEQNPEACLIAWGQPDGGVTVHSVVKDGEKLAWLHACTNAHVSERIRKVE